MQIIGAGFGRTGTLSLKTALEMLGFDKCYHMLEVRQHPDHPAIWSKAHAGEPVSWPDLFAGYEATVDWPSCNFWEHQLQTYPEAKVILSLRDADAWYQSVMNTIYPITVANLQADDPERRQAGRWAMEIIWDAKFDGRMEDKAHVIACFEAHNRHVIDTVPAAQLLVYRPGDGWEPLCDFLDVPVPSVDYPRTNSTAEFQAMMGERQAR
ncbi:MAG: sulfotransferase family protein [Pseudomonadota bacterium]